MYRSGTPHWTATNCCLEATFVACRQQNPNPKFAPSRLLATPRSPRLARRCLRLGACKKTGARSFPRARNFAWGVGSERERGSTQRQCAAPLLLCALAQTLPWSWGRRDAAPRVSRVSPCIRCAADGVLARMSHTFGVNVCLSAQQFFKCAICVHRLLARRGGHRRLVPGMIQFSE